MNTCHLKNRAERNGEGTSVSYTFKMLFHHLSDLGTKHFSFKTLLTRTKGRASKRMHLIHFNSLNYPIRKVLIAYPFYR